MCVCAQVNSCLCSAACLFTVTIFRRSRIREHGLSVCVCVCVCRNRQRKKERGDVCCFSDVRSHLSHPLMLFLSSELAGCHGNGSPCCWQHPITLLSSPLLSARSPRRAARDQWGPSGAAEGGGYTLEIDAPLMQFRASPWQRAWIRPLIWLPLNVNCFL